MSKELKVIPIDQINAVPAATSKARQESLLDVGQVEPIKLRPDGSGRYDIIDGRRRIANMQAAGITEVEAQVEPMDDKRAALVGLILHAGRSASPMVEARQIQALLNSGWTQAQLAKAIGRTQGWISQRLSYFDLIPELQDRLDSGQITISTARSARKLTKAQQRELVDGSEDEDGKITEQTAAEALREAQAKQASMMDQEIPDMPGRRYTVVLDEGQLETLETGASVEIRIAGTTYTISPVAKA